ncbi:MAG: FtsQ-type POTRA domain-containing protein [Chloroflexi bacterium]|nr:FtsQ-type POTRA domain-containing protein [Chloroflexota bacterium]
MRTLPRAIVRRTGVVTVGERRPSPPRRRGNGNGDGGVIGVAEERRERGFPIGLKTVVALCAVAVVLGLAAGGWWVVQSPYFEIATVKVEGTDRVAPEDIATVSGLAGQSMFRADLGKAQAGIMALPLVKDVQIERKWPRQVRIVVAERQPWGAWVQSGVSYTIDRDGVVLGAFPAPDGGPVISSAEAGSPRAGDRVDYQAVDAAAEIYEKLPQQLNTQVTQVAFAAGKGVQVTTADGQTALLGDSSSIAYKLAVWAAIAKKSEERGLAYNTIDLRFGNRPVVQ